MCDRHASSIAADAEAIYLGSEHPTCITLRQEPDQAHNALEPSPPGRPCWQHLPAACIPLACAACFLCTAVLSHEVELQQHEAVTPEKYACRWRRWEHLLRGSIIWGIFVVLTLFYLVPVSAVQALIEVDRLNQIAFFRALTNIRFINAILQAILPSALLLHLICCCSSQYQAGMKLYTMLPCRSSKPWL